MSCSLTLTEPLWTMVLWDASCREWGNLSDMVRQALPRHTTSYDLLKKHIRATSPNFTLSVSHLFPLLPSAISYFHTLTSFLFIAFSHFFGPRFPSSSRVVNLTAEPPPPTSTTVAASLAIHRFLTSEPSSRSSPPDA